MVVLDTNILIAYFNGDERIANRFIKWRKTGVRFFISVITEIELSSLPKLTSSELTIIQNLVREFTIIPLDSQLGKLTADLRRQTSLSLGDSVIVATAELTGARLATRDKNIIKKARRFVVIEEI